MGKACVQSVLSTVENRGSFQPSDASYGLFRLRGSWAEGTTYISGNCMCWNGSFYELSETGDYAFEISGDFGGGSATFTPDEITWANGSVWQRFDFALRGFWAESSVQISGARLYHKGLNPAFYTLSNITDNSFDISDDYGGGSATYTADEIQWANGVVYARA